MLSYEFQKESEYLHFTLTCPALTNDSAKELFADIVEAAKLNQCRKVLIERFDVALEFTAFDAYEVVDYLTEIELHRHRMAIVFRKNKPGILEDFFETVARNRGHQIKFFALSGKAIEWLIRAEGRGLQVG